MLKIELKIKGEASLSCFRFTPRAQNDGSHVAKEY